MAEVTMESRRAAAEAARRAQAAAMRAAAEHQRLLAEQAAQTSPGASAGEVTRENFVANARVGESTAEREAIFDRLNTDGSGRLSQAELAAFFEAQALPAAPAVSEGVQGDLGDAFRDDDNTLDDLMDAAGHVETAADVDAILAAAEATGQDQRAVLQRVLRQLDEDADTPETAMYEAIAGHFARLGEPDAAAAARAAGDPAIARDVRRPLTHALHDDTDTADDLRDAARGARTPAELAAMMAAGRATGAATPTALLREALLGLDEDAEEPNSALLNAIGDEFEQAGQPEMAEAARAAADPSLDREVRKELIHAIQDDVDTAEDIADALEAATSTAEQRAAETTGDATIGEAPTDALVAVDEVRAAQAAFDQAMADVAAHSETLQLAMAQMAGMNPAEIQRFAEAFQANHPEFAAVEARREELAATVAEHRDAIGDLLSQPLPASLTDRQAIERAQAMNDLAGALAVAAASPAGLEAVGEITTRVIEASDVVHEDLLGRLAEDVVPALMEAKIKVGLEASGGDAAAAMRGLQESALFEAMAGVDELGGVRSDYTRFVRGVRELDHFLQNGNGTEAISAIRRQMSGTGRLDGALASVGLVLGGFAFAEADGWSNQALASLGLAGDGVSLARAAGKMFSSLNLDQRALGRASGVIGVVAGSISGVRSLMNGDLDDAAFAGLNVAIGVLTLTNWVPGLGIASTLVMAGQMIYANWQDDRAHERQVAEIRDLMVALGHDAGFADFLTNSDPGAYEAVQANMGFDHDQIVALVGEGRTLTRQLDDFATPDFQTFVAPALTQGGEDLFAVLGRLDDGLDVEGAEFLGDVLEELAAPWPDPVSGEPLPLAQRFDQVLINLAVPIEGSTGFPQRDRAIGNLREALGLA